MNDLSIDVKFIGCEDVCRMLGFSRQYLGQLEARGIGPRHVRKSPRQALYTVESVESWLEHYVPYARGQVIPPDHALEVAASHWLTVGEVKALGITVRALEELAVPRQRVSDYWLYHLAGVQEALTLPKYGTEEHARQRIRNSVKHVPGPMDTPCWIWQRSFNPNGYGRMSYLSKADYAHRVSHIVFNGELTREKPFACHKCNVPACVNPEHLYAGTPQTNVDDREAAMPYRLKLTDADRERVWARDRQTPLSYLEIAGIAKELGCSLANVLRLVKRGRALRLQATG